MTVTHTVLYADDDLDDIQLLHEVFKHHSKNVHLLTFNDGLQILTYLENLTPEDIAPCLIILDINMPLMNGKETLVQLRKMERYKDVPTIMFTTSSQPRDKEFAFKYNAGFITKPINYKQLDRVADILIDHCAEEVKKKIKISRLE